MNFYRLRVINTLLLFFLGIMIGIYLGRKKIDPKNLFNKFDDYKPLYYGKWQNISDESNYRPIYIDNKKIDQDNISHRLNLSTASYKILEDMKFSSNPMDDDVYLVDYNFDDEKIELHSFLVDPLKYKGKKISAKRIILLRGERKGKNLVAYFFTKVDEKDYYLAVDISDHSKYNLKDFRIGYYYNVDFITSGMLDRDNTAVSIEATGDKAEWASGVEAF